MRLEVIAQSRGKFKCSNRDSHIARAFGDDYFLAAVADGMDGDKGYGDRMKVARASRAAIKFLEQSVQHDKDRPLKEIVEETEQRMLGSRLSKETTLTTVSIREGYLEIAQLGDSVAYLFRDGEAIRLVNQQTDRQLLEIVFGKHPSKITLEELLQVFNRNSRFY